MGYQGCKSPRHDVRRVGEGARPADELTYLDHERRSKPEVLSGASAGDTEAHAGDATCRVATDLWHPLDVILDSVGLVLIV
jgi:hypothetical protein